MHLQILIILMSRWWHFWASTVCTVNLDYRFSLTSFSWVLNGAKVTSWIQLLWLKDHLSKLWTFLLSVNFARSSVIPVPSVELPSYLIAHDVCDRGPTSSGITVDHFIVCLRYFPASCPVHAGRGSFSLWPGTVGQINVTDQPLNWPSGIILHDGFTFVREVFFTEPMPCYLNWHS